MKSSGTIVYFEDNKTLFHVAAEHGQLHCLQKLINIWPRDYINMVDGKNRTALHLAAMNGHRYFLLVKFFIDTFSSFLDNFVLHWAFAFLVTLFTVLRLRIPFTYLLYVCILCSNFPLLSILNSPVVASFPFNIHYYFLSISNSYSCICFANTPVSHFKVCSSAFNQSKGRNEYR